MSDSDPGRSLAILSMCDRPYPTQQAFLEEVVAKLLPARGHRVVWILQSQSGQQQVQRVCWHGSDVVLLPGNASRSVLGRLHNALVRIVQLTIWSDRLASSESIDVVQVRNGMWAGLCAIRIRHKHGIPFVFQYSRPGPEFHLVLGQSAGGLSRWSRLARAKLEREVLRFVMQRADHLLPISDWMTEALVAQGLSRARMTSFPLGFNTAVSPDAICGVRSPF